MAITVQRILIDDSGAARAFYVNSEGPAGSLLVPLDGTPQLDALKAEIVKAIEAKVVDEASMESRDAARERLEAELAARRPKPGDQPAGPTPGTLIKTEDPTPAPTKGKRGKPSK